MDLKELVEQYKSEDYRVQMFPSTLRVLRELREEEESKLYRALKDMEELED